MSRNGVLSSWPGEETYRIPLYDHAYSSQMLLPTMVNSLKTHAFFIVDYSEDADAVHIVECSTGIVAIQVENVESVVAFSENLGEVLVETDSGYYRIQVLDSKPIAYQRLELPSKDWLFDHIIGEWEAGSRILGYSQDYFFFAPRQVRANGTHWEGFEVIMVGKYKEEQLVKWPELRTRIMRFSREHSVWAVLSEIGDVHFYDASSLAKLGTIRASSNRAHRIMDIDFSEARGIVYTISTDGTLTKRRAF